MAEIDKKKILEIFINHFNEFLEDVVLVFPDDKEVHLLKDFLCLFAKFNKTKLIGFWKQCVIEKYERQISDNNYKFFINKDWRDDIKKIKNNDIIVDKINQLRSCVEEMNETNKLKTIKYIDNLSKLCDLYISYD
jgi:hypothetical protein